MENRAHYVLIGMFTLIVVAALLLFALWLGKVGLNKHYHHYRIVFTEAVTGLTSGSQVQYNGIRVGEVERLKLDPKDPRKILVRIEVNADTPVKADTRAELGKMGFTGGALVQLTGGTPAAESLLPTASNPVPTISAKSSGMGNLLATGNRIATKLDTILDRLDQVVSQQNVDHVDHALANIDKTTRTLAAEREDLRALIRQAASASKRLDETLAKTNRLLDGPGKKTLADTRRAMASLAKTGKTLDQLLANNREALQSGLRGTDQLGPTLRQMRTTLRHLDQLTRKLQGNPGAYLLDRKHPAEFTPTH